MEEDWTTFSPLGLVIKYDYVKIDVLNNYGEVNIVDLRNEKVLMKLFINLKEDVVEKEGSLENYDMDEEATITEIKGNVEYFISKGITNPFN
ncbi:hypothetical protein ACQ4XT_13465 [Halobacillus faecis]